MNKDFILVSNRLEKTDGKDSTLIYSFNRIDIVRSGVCSFSEGLFSPTSFFSKRDSESEVSFFKWGDVYPRNGYSGSNGQIDYPGIENLYNEYGYDFVCKCKGSFLIVVKNGNTISLIADQLHARSVYYYNADKLLIVSSSLSALILFLRRYNQSVKVNIQYLIEYCLFNYSLNNSSLILNVYETQPGQIIHLNNNSKEMSFYFDVTRDLVCSGPQMNHKEGIEYLKEVFRSNVSLYDRGPDTTAVAFTGGYDSRSVVASLGAKYKDYQYYSYGRPGSWDVKIPEKIALHLGMEYKAFHLDDYYESRFVMNGELALLLSDGVGKISLGNYVHVYSSFFDGKTNILTGLFGSELIKRFSGANLALNQNMLDILTAGVFNPVLNALLNRTIYRNFFSENIIESYIDNIQCNLDSNILINNGFEQNRKVFLHYLSLGTRKYFQQELKIQSPWVNNLHPFYDIDFIEALLETPYPNIYNWKLKKSLIKNLSTHKLYWGLINQKPELTGFISTHGFRPGHLRSKLYTPLIAFDYIATKRRVKRNSSMTNSELTQMALKTHLSLNPVNSNSLFYRMITSADKNSSDYLKMFSVYLWLKKHNIDV